MSLDEKLLEIDKSRKPPSTDEGKKPDYAKILSRSSVRRNDNGNPRWANPYFHFFRDHIRFLCFEIELVGFCETA